VIAVHPAVTSQRCSGCGVLAVACWRRRGYPCAGALARSAGRSSIGTTTPPRICKGAGSACGDSRRDLRGRTENPSGCSPCEVSAPIGRTSRRRMAIPRH
jgi:hypothetical protein